MIQSEFLTFNQQLLQNIADTLGVSVSDLDNLTYDQLLLIAINEGISSAGGGGGMNVQFFTDTSFFPTTGTENIIYVSKETSELYIWSTLDKAYGIISGGTGTTPIFIDETFNISDFKSGKTYYYIGESDKIFDYDLEPYPNPIPESGYNLVNLSVHNITVNSDGGNSTYILTPNQRLRDVQIFDNGNGVWAAYPTEYFDNIYDLQKVTNKGTETTNAIIVKNNPDTYRTRYSILGQEVQKDDLGYRVLYSHFALRKSTTTGVKTWELQYPDINSNTNNSSYVVSFRPNLSGTVAYLSDIPGITPPYTHNPIITINGTDFELDYTLVPDAEYTACYTNLCIRLDRVTSVLNLTRGLRLPLDITFKNIDKWVVRHVGQDLAFGNLPNTIFDFKGVISGFSNTSITINNFSTGSIQELAFPDISAGFILPELPIAPTFPNLKKLRLPVGGTINFNQTVIRQIIFPVLEEIDVTTGSFAQLTKTIDYRIANTVFPALKKAPFFQTNNISFPTLTLLSLPEALIIDGINPFTRSTATADVYNFPKAKAIRNISLDSGGRMTKLNFPAVEEIHNFLINNTSNTLTEFSCPLLQKIENIVFNLRSTLITNLGNTLGTNVFPSLKYLGTFTFTNLTGDILPTISFPNLEVMPASVSIRGRGIQNFTLGTIGVTKQTAQLHSTNFNQCVFAAFGGVDLSNNALTQQSVDDLLALLVSLDGTNGTLFLTGVAANIINLTGGTNSAPSAAGIVNANILRSRGFTVNHN